MKHTLSPISLGAAQHSSPNLAHARGAEMLSPHARDLSAFNIFTDHDADNDEESQVDSPYLPAEIPDSQPETTSPTSRTCLLEISDSQHDRLNHEFIKVDSQSDFSSFRTTATELLPAPLQVNKRLGNRFPLHKRGICCNGRLPAESPQYRPKDGEKEMDEEGTQPLTQPRYDPRRGGQRDSVPNDEADIICILMPSNHPAVEAVALTAQAAPQHILQNGRMSQLDNDDDLIEDEESSKQNRKTQDIALRFSSRIHNARMGFTFGRNPKFCDLLLGKVENKKFSNRHFRIFINEYGSLMVEDTSTNGTIVDGTVLRCEKAKVLEDVRHPRHTLHHGAIIELPTMTRQSEETLRFIVHMPSREGCEDKYRQNLQAYIAYVAQVARQAMVLEEAAKEGHPITMPQTPINAFGQPQQQVTTPHGSILAAATSGNNSHGLNWNGGRKYNVINRIGSGAFALVYKLSSKRDGEPYAVKEISKDRFMKDGHLGIKFHNELNLLKSLNHPNIVRYIEHHETSTHLFIVMEFMPYGDLTLWTTPGKAMPEFMCAEVARQMMQALDYLHTRGITHRDIKPDNILQATDFPYVFKLSDFGLSKIVTSEETFLKTFCGTLLYCAPEIYPDYPGAKRGYQPPTRRTRAGDGRPAEPQPYKASVDTWSLAAVLFHLICGRAPYPGTPGDKGAIMFATIMNLPVEWSLLDQAGVSEHGIDFLKSMLVIDPSQRPSDSTLLEHAWLQGTNDAPAVGTGDELDASQLSLRDKTEASSALEEEAEIERRDYDFWADQLGMPMPRLARPPPSGLHPPPPNRLFGEIGSSALRSSGALGQDAHGALGVPTGVAPTTGSYDPSSSSASFTDAPHVEYTSAGAQANSVRYPDLHHSMANPTGAPSLLGAESLVDNFHMASTESGKSREVSPTLTGSKRPIENASSEDERSTTKRPRTAHNHLSSTDQRQSAEPPARHDSDVSLIPTAANSPAPAQDPNEGGKTSDRGPSRPQSASNSVCKEPSRRESPDIPNLPPTAPTSITASLQPAITTDNSTTFLRPPVRFGNLIPTRGSTPTVPRVIVSSRATTFGRDKKCTFIHPDAMEDRIPKNAIDLQMWYPGIEKDIQAGKTDIESHKDLVAVISTRASRYIKVNGVRLIMGKDRKYFGRLRTGDIITIFEFAEGQTPKTDKDKEFLRFRAEFFIGLSKEVRKPGEPFVVETDDANIRQVLGKKSTESSVAGASAAGSVCRGSVGRESSNTAPTITNTAAP